MWLRLGKSDQNSCILLNKLAISIYSVSISNTLRPCLSPGTPVPSLISCWTGLGLQDKGSTSPAAWDWAPGLGVHGASLEPIQHRQQLLLAWALRLPEPGWQLSCGCRWLYQPQCCSPSLCCSTLPCHWGLSLRFGAPGSQLIPLHVAAPWHFPSWAATHQSWNSQIF